MKPLIRDMSKHKLKNKRKPKVKKIKNPVAKFFNQVNKPSIERDRTKYSRKQKHKGVE